MMFTIFWVDFDFKERQKIIRIGGADLKFVKKGKHSKSPPGTIFQFSGMSVLINAFHFPPMVDFMSVGTYTFQAHVPELQFQL